MHAGTHAPTRKFPCKEQTRGSFSVVIVVIVLLLLVLVFVFLVVLVVLVIFLFLVESFSEHLDVGLRPGKRRSDPRYADVVRAVADLGFANVKRVCDVDAPDYVCISE